ncbi:endonuclease [Microbacterium phage Hendrix]|uniref:Holliday junction resolvase n=1 Tax=Microbacterium phage Hendrix TaxID=2182341 RepID=A0A2U8UUG5_9CAUD|nr:endonuclease [Microbacterium phage Hendrix]AWN07814.1 holliday junction resolvase [Microbacterium phage Hendrix]
MARTPTYRDETALVKAIVIKIKTKYPDAWIMKVHGGPMQTAGIPDLLICVNGLLIGAEIKHQKPRESEAHARGRATPLQHAQIAKIQASGGVAGVALTPDETLALVELAIEQNRNTNQEIQNVERD